LDFAKIPQSWFEIVDVDATNARARGGINSKRQLACNVFDIFDAAAAGKDLGRMTGKFKAVVPPHGVRFLRLSGCSVTLK
jgi:hypothetical protein